MKTFFLNPRVMMASVFGIAVIVTTLFISSNLKLKKNLISEKIKSENLLSEKLKTDKNLSVCQEEAFSLKHKNAKLDKQIADSNRKIAEKNEEINKLVAQNASVKELQKKLKELEQLKEQLRAEIAGLNHSLELANAENSRLNGQLTWSSKANSSLSSDNYLLKAMLSDNYRTEALKGKHDRLTVNSRRTNKLMVSFDLPQNSDNNVYFKVKTPEGKEFSSKNSLSASVKIMENSDNLIASTDPSFVGNVGTSRVELTYQPKQKLGKGVYQFNLYNGDRFLGSTQLRLK